MHSLRDLLNQKVAIEAEIAARKPEAIAAIHELMTTSGVTIEDLGGVARAGRGSPPGTVPPGAKRPVKYRDSDGNAWTGVGQRPRWLRKALLEGATLEQFLAKQ